nr:rhodanese-like domain-containing protein [Chloroflexaceae bacterium]
MKQVRFGSGVALVSAVLVSVLTLAACGTAPAAQQAPAPAAPAAQQQAAPQQAAAVKTPRSFDEVVVSTDWLAQNLQNPQVRIVEVSVVPGLYERGHIPGAVNFVWTTDFVDTLTRNIVAPDRFQELARNAGINSDTTIVLYGDNSNWFAAWGAWVFRQYGAQDVRLLDGSR